MSAWTPELEPTSLGAGAVTLVEGSCFCLSTRGGDLGGVEPNGVFFRDTRILSRWDLQVDGTTPEPLAALTPEPYRGTFVSRVALHTGRTDSHLLVRRDRWVGNGLREDVTIDNPSGEPVTCTVTLSVDGDFADLFEVKEGRVQARGRRSARKEGDGLLLELHVDQERRAVVVLAPGATLTTVTCPDGSTVDTGARVAWDVVLPPRGSWSASLLAHPRIDGEDVEPAFPLDRPLGTAVPAQRRERWRATTPIATAGHEGLQRVLRRSQEDLGSLRIFGPHDDSPAVAAGAPWFMALFGRDSLLTAYMALPVDRDLALGTLRILARHQGRVTDARTEEEPGRILHEVRLGVEAGLALGGGSTYYGSVDATPLFVVLLGELARWGADPREVAELLPHADRALHWVRHVADRDGDGFVDYQRTSDRGLANQGWKDSWDGITFADGEPAQAPLALCEVQGYVYDAYRTRATLARSAGDDGDARAWDRRAADLKAAFNERFWLPERGWFALALDRDGRSVDACASNMGHCLWSGIVDDDLAPRVVEHLMSPAMFSGWGIRTLSTEMGAYDPASYHNGSVWPHDNALVVAGLVRYGFVAEAQQVAQAVLEAAEHFGGRLPELFCGFARDEHPAPIPYPTSCSPQAWAAATPVHLVRTLLRFDPDLPEGRLRLDPVLPETLSPLRVEGITLGAARVDLVVTGDEVVVEGVPEAVTVHRGEHRDQHGG